MMYNSKIILSIIFAIVMATSTIAMPAVAGGISSTSQGARADFAGADTIPGLGVGETTVSDDSANTSIDALFEAVERLEELETESQAGENAVNETLASINGSLSEFRSLRGADSEAAFEHLRDAQNQLSNVAAETDDDDTVEDVSRLLYEASALNANLAVDDAEKTLDRHDDTFPNRGQERKTERAIDSANRALERGSDAAGDDKPPRGPPGDSLDRTIDTHANAITHHRTAWRHAERALETIAEHTEPQISVTQRQTFEENGSVQALVEVELTDVRAHAFDADVHLEQGSAEPIELSTGRSTASTATGIAQLDIGPEPENQTVTVTATSTDDPERSVETTLEIRLDDETIIRDLPAPDEHRQTEVTDEDSGVTVNVEGNGVHESLISVEDRTPETDDAYRAGPMVRIVNQTSFDQAEVTVPVDADAFDREDGNLSIYTWDPEDDEPWTPVETEINRDAGTASAEVDSFSFFSVFWIEDWEDETSDTITLDGNETDGDVGSGGDMELADFVFVIDESGSMGGSPIHYASEAAKRFVSALTEDERAGLVGYASGARLDQPLTREHDAVNDSLDGLSAGGGTDTEAGLRKGLQHLEENRLENRTQVIILLSDGKSNSGSYPRRVAEEAADKGIEISTVGLGNGIDENELRDIAAITGGDFYHVRDADDLPDTFERVAENQTGVNLADTNGDGIPDRVAEMDLSMPTGPDGAVGEPLNLDPVALDTSGDGIPDNETVDIDYRIFEEDNETKLTGQVTYADHHPNRVDTTRDGLTDAEQIEGWEILYTDERDATQEVMEALDDDEHLDTVAEQFESSDVSANPLLEDTNGDGLSDLEERQLGTDPRSADTTGDGIPDADAAAAENADPTLYDSTPPEIDILLANYYKLSGSFTAGVDIRFIVDDPAGVSGAAVRKDGDRQETYSIDGKSEYVEDEFELGRVDTFTDFYGGATISIEATDQNDNSVQVIGQEQSDVFGELAEEYAAESIENREAANDLGTLSGFSTGATETVDFVRAFVDDPAGYIAAITEIVEVLRDLGVLAEIPAQIDQQQDQNNPFDENDTEEEQLYEGYRQGWYEGYVAYFVLEMAVPGSETGKVVKRSDRVQTVVTQLDRTGHLRQVARYAGKTRTAAYAPVRVTGHQLSRGLAASSRLGTVAVQQVLSPVRSSGQQMKAAKHVDSDAIDARTIDRLSAGEQERFGEYLARHGDNGVRFIADGSGNAMRLVTRTDALDPATLNRVHRAHDRGIIDNDDLRRIANGLEDGTIDQQAVTTALVRVNRLDTRDHEIVKVKTAKNANKAHDGQPPHKEGTLVVEYEIQSPETFVRVYEKSEGAGGRWHMKKSEFRNLETRGDVMDRFALSEEWQNYNHVADIEVGADSSTRGIRAQVSTAGKVTDHEAGVTRSGGGTQHYFPDVDLEGWTNERPLGELLEDT